MTWLAVGLAVGLACGGTLMTWWSSKRIEREGTRQYEMGIAEGVQIAERDHKSKSGRLWKKRPWISLVILWLRIAQNLHQNPVALRFSRSAA